MATALATLETELSDGMGNRGGYDGIDRFVADGDGDDYFESGVRQLEALANRRLPNFDGLLRSVENGISRKTMARRLGPLATESSFRLQPE